MPMTDEESTLLEKAGDLLEQATRQLAVNKQVMQKSALYIANLKAELLHAENQLYHVTISRNNWRGGCLVLLLCFIAVIANAIWRQYSVQ